ncbi:hypothetical protein Q73A0000_05765 [Kaistella flava (ex Peng et al. 2021)]|uniref:Uncharacterized protein n=1 Tax=Kaistella flava (ex Peng et al. 2021) TaxID=2038776 RepID=A0A7M2Y730_9FLAO|nr:hypothetical protein [Kaistella flava (ex Peng et al. 2021)]QOW09900.1 hypothetical protein Q73A0000_05765 [Kaistella flava (ex Peng et al. 2021)]
MIPIHRISGVFVSRSDTYKRVSRKSMKAVVKLIFILLSIQNYSQNTSTSYCFESIENDGIKTKLQIEVFPNRNYIWKSQNLSSPNFGKIENQESGVIIERDGKLYLGKKDSEPNSEFPIKMTKTKLIILGLKKVKKFLSNKYEYKLVNGIIFRKNNCGNN